ncbi:methionine--tRNA ligase [Candidatus Bathyarchaeota archaeon]|nr:methionine--tRNA ligase [Candidatus Bathyarchaeota archaeon]
MKDLKKRILITSALIYANGPIHIGHLVEYIQTDIYIRFLKLNGHNAFYCGADDTHGTPIEINAAKEGVTPEEFISRWWKQHDEDYKKYGIIYDSYYTTNSPENQKYTELIFQKLKDANYIYTKDIELTYCENCKRYLPDRYVKGTCPKCGAKDQYGDVCEKCNAAYSTIDLIDPYCSICGSKPIKKNSLHYFFKLSEFSSKLEDWLNKNNNLQPEIRNQILVWIKEGLHDWCISRDGPYFGFKIPGEENKFFYVWLDAPIGYIASTANYCKNKDFTADDIWQNSDSTIIHFIGKDIIYFHLLFWPAVLMGAGFHVPDNIVVHGFLNVNGEKMSKSRGTFLTARELADLLEPELLRYYYAANLSHTMTDIDLDLNNLENRINNELVSNIANLIYRTLSFLNRNFDSQTSTILNNELYEEIKRKAENIQDSYYNYEFRDSVKEILEISSIGNKYFQDNQPWELIKSDKEKTRRILTDCVNIVKTILILIKPIMPKFAENIEEQLSLPNLTFKELDKRIENHEINQAKIILKKIDPIILKKPKEKDDIKTTFPILDLKVGKVIEVKDHPKADKLWILKVDIGSEKIQLCAGLKPYYPQKDDLLNKHLVVITNLKPTKLRGEISQGMLLAADGGTNVGILIAPKTPPGSNVIAEGITGLELPEVTIEIISKLKMEAKSGSAYINNKLLHTENESILIDKNIEGKIR